MAIPHGSVLVIQNVLMQMEVTGSDKLMMNRGELQLDGGLPRWAWREGRTSRFCFMEAMAQLSLVMKLLEG